MQWGNRGKQNDQHYHVKASFFSSSWQNFFSSLPVACYVICFEEMSSSLPVACYVICSCSKTFFKTGVLKNFAILYSEENICVGAAF